MKQSDNVAVWEQDDLMKRQSKYKMRVQHFSETRRRQVDKILDDPTTGKEEKRREGIDETV